MPKLGKLRISYEIRENRPGRVEVLLDDKVVCELPATQLDCSLKAGDLGVVTVHLLAERLDADTHS